MFIDSSGSNYKLTGGWFSYCKVRAAFCVFNNYFLLRFWNYRFENTVPRRYKGILVLLRSPFSVYIALSILIDSQYWVGS